MLADKALQVENVPAWQPLTPDQKNALMEEVIMEILTMPKRANPSMRKTGSSKT